MGNGHESEINEFKTWIRRHRQHFKTYNLDEIIYLAVMVGFDKAVICQEVLDGARDVQSNTTSALRVWWNVTRDIEYVENQARPYLADKWLELAFYQTGEEWS